MEPHIAQLSSSIPPEAQLTHACVLACTLLPAVAPSDGGDFRSHIPQIFLATEVHAHEDNLKKRTDLNKKMVARILTQRQK
jgi:hypothetical protein